MMLSDQLTPSGSMLDAFGRLKVGNPLTIFDSQLIDTDGLRFDTATSNNGTFVYSSNTSSGVMTVSTDNGSKVVRQTKRVMPYQPGKSLQIIVTFAMGTPKANVTQRVGYFDEGNGIFFENNGVTNYLVIRSNVSGSVVERRIAQADWNIDRFDGKGYSGQTGDKEAHANGIDVSKTNIFWTDIEWLGVGDVRCGFVVDGKPIVAHVFHNDNRNTDVYMKTACLPVRYEIVNTGTTTSSTILKQICSTVISEGGYQGRSVLQGISRGFTIAQAVDLGLAGTEVPLISIRLAANKKNSIVIPHATHIYVDSNQSISYRWIKNYGTLDGSWVQHPTYGSSVEYNITSTAAGSTLGATSKTQVVQGGFITAGAASTAGGLDNYDYQLGRFLDGTSETFTLTAIGMNNNTKILSKMDWFQIV